ncbi:MAG TPA: ABC transporter permease [Thermoanaerobaculia bacterium]|nr:ABC transporter permease [Thermoanaerobaculia bacterium]
MPLLARGSSMMRNLFRRERVDQDLDEEIGSYLAALVEEKVAAGMSPEAARRAAAIEVGGVEQVKERVRQARAGALLESLVQDLRYGLRTLARNPGFTAAAVLTLGLGIGANTAIFSVVDGVLLSPLAGRDPDRLVMLWEMTPDTPQIPVSYPNYLDWRQRVRSFEDIAVYNGFDQFTMTGEGDPERVRGGLASGNLFTVFGVEPAAGRLLDPRDDSLDAEPAAVIADGFWRRRFAADPRVVGKSILLDGNAYTIVGVLPPSFRLAGSEVWLPLGRFTHTPRFVRANHGLIGIGRLKPEVTIDRMLADLGAVARQLQRDHPADNAGIGAAGAPLKEMMVGSIRQPLRVLAAAVGLVLLVACANVANLLLSRAASRQHEFALRVAIGAGRRRVVRQLITESLLLAVAGGVLGLGLAWAGVKLLVALRPANVPRLMDIQVDATVLAFALGLSVVTGLLFGLAPALHLARSEPILALQEGGRRTSGGRARRRLATGLTVAEVAIALVLLVVAGLLLRSFARLTGVDPGFEPRNATAALVSLPERDYPDEARRRLAFRELLWRVRALPQMQDAALATDLPLTTSWQTQVTFAGRPPADPGSEPFLNAVIASPEYFRTMRIRLLAGRGIEPADAQGRSRVVVVSESVARRFFGGRGALGQRMKQGGAGVENPWLTIVGIVADVRNDGLRIASRGTMYVPHEQSDASSAWLVVRSETPLEQLLPLLRREIAAFDRNLPLANVTTLDDALDSSVAQERFSMLMVGIFAALALVLAAVGIYGVIAYSVAQRSQEIGVRIALGARRADVLALVVGEGMRLTLLGIVLGAAAALGAGRVIASLLFEIEPGDPAVLAGAALLVAAVALLAAGLPALRAAQTDPRAALSEG